MQIGMTTLFIIISFSDNQAVSNIVNSGSMNADLQRLTVNGFHCANVNAMTSRYICAHVWIIKMQKLQTGMQISITTLHKALWFSDN